MMNSLPDSPWLRYMAPQQRGKLKLFCFPYAGSGPSVYRDWLSVLSPDIELVAIHYPGRESRSDEPLIGDLGEMVEQLLPQIVPHLDKPFAFFGHSMGAYVAFILCQALAKSQRKKPEHLFLSGAGAPHIDEPNPIAGLDSKDFFRALLQLNGIAPQVLKSPELISYGLPILRADFSACEQFNDQISTPLQLPITLLGGKSDPRVCEHRLLAWQGYSEVSVNHHWYEGDHFFIHAKMNQVVRLVNTQLLSLL